MNGLKRIVVMLAVVCVGSQLIYGQYEGPYVPNKFQYNFVDAGSSHTVALRCDGTVWTWGSNASGQLGNTSVGAESDVPVPVEPPSGGGDTLKNVVEVAAGGNFTMARLADSTILAWGSDGSGQLGNGADGGTTLPDTVVGIDNAIEVDAGDNYVYALLADGTVRSWGGNASGQLGSGNTSSRETPGTVVGLDTTVIDVSCGAGHTLVAEANGHVRSVGANDARELGYGNSSDSKSTFQYVVDEGFDDTINSGISVAAGGSHSLALLASGHVLSWGSVQTGNGNGNGEVGRDCPDAPTCSYADTVVLGVSVTNATAIDAGPRYTYVLTSDSNMIAFGDNEDGQLGLGSTSPKVDPTYVSSLSNDKILAMATGIDELSANGTHGIILADDDTIKTTGLNNSGQLGIGGTTDQDSFGSIKKITLGKIEAYAGEDTTVCTGGKAQLGQGIPPEDTTRFIYNWTPSTGLSDPTIPNPEASLSVSNTQSITYILTKQYKDMGAAPDVCIIEDTVTVTYSSGVEPDFKSSAPVCEDDSVDFLNTGTSGSSYKYEWSLGAGADPSVTNTENPKDVFYDSYGLKKVTFTIYDSVCNDTASVTDGIHIREEPVVSFDLSTDSICPSASVGFTNTGSSGSKWNYQWNFGSYSDPSESTAEHPEGITYSESGNKAISFRISSEYCSGSADSSLFVRSIPIADFTSGSSVCTGDSMTFSNTGTSGASVYEWDFGQSASPSSFSGEDPPAVMYDTAGNKTVTLVVSNGYCADTVARSVTVHKTPDIGFTVDVGDTCGSSVSFTNTGVSDSLYTYQWDFGEGADPSSSTSEHPEGILYTQGGLKTITFSIQSSECSARDTGTIKLYDTPEADFSSNAPQCNGDTVAFSNLSTSGLSSYEWDFGPGATPSASNIEDPAPVVYSTAGNKTVQLIASNGHCSDTAINSLVINQTPDVSFTADVGDTCGSSVSFTNTGSSDSLYTYQWDFGEGADPSSSTSEHPEGILYTQGGRKTITFSIQSSECSARDTGTIKLYNTPEADFSSNAPQCSGDTVAFSNLSTSGVSSYEWDFGAGATPSSSDIEEPGPVVYSTAGNKTVQLIASNGHCPDTAINSLVINQTPNVSFTADIGDTCGSSVSFTNTGASDSLYTYQWDFGEGADPSSSTSEHPEGIRYTQGGRKTITFSIQSSECSARDTGTIKLYNTPEADFSSNAPQCSGDTVAFSNLSTSGLSSYEWDFGTGATPSASNIEDPARVVYSTAGNKTVQLIVSNGHCPDTAINSLVINKTPEVSFSSNLRDSCAGRRVSFTNTGVSDSLYTYQWDFGEGAEPSSSTAEHPDGIKYSSGGTKTITFGINSDHCSGKDTGSIRIYEKPEAAFSSNAPKCTGDSVDFVNTGTANADYVWDFGKGSAPDTSRLENPTNVTYSSAGNIEVELITSLDYCNDTFSKSITIHRTPEMGFIYSPVSLCAGESLDITNTGSEGDAWTYSWDFGKDGLPPSSTNEDPSGIKYNSGGEKVITQYITNGVCSDVYTDTLDIYSLPEVKPGNDTTICADRRAHLGSAPVSGYTYRWSPSHTLDDPGKSAPVASPEAAVTTYHLEVTDTAGCVNTDSVTVTMISPGLADAGPDAEICKGDTVQLGTGLVEGQTYSWSPAGSLTDAQVSNPFAFPDTTTNYTLSISYHGCDTVTDETKVTVRPLPAATIVEDSIKMAKGESTILNASGGVMYNWEPSVYLSNDEIYNPEASPEESLRYTVYVQNIYGCVNSDSVYMNVVDPELFIPNAFTPDGDGRNDVFRIRGSRLEDFEMRIYNRSGEQMFYTTSFDEGWDGVSELSGKAAPEGAYVYHVSGKTPEGKRVKRKGIVNLIR